MNAKIILIIIAVIGIAATTGGILFKSVGHNDDNIVSQANTPENTPSQVTTITVETQPNALEQPEFVTCVLQMEKLNKLTKEAALKKCKCLQFNICN